MVKKIIITGGPGTGKTSLIEELKKNNFKCFDEISRGITLKYRKKGIEQLFLSDPNLFSQELLNGRIQQFNKSINLQADCVFFDRGIPDIIAYLNFKKVDLSKKILESVDKYKYDMIFLLEPWEDIYSSDIIRYESFDQVITIDSYIKNTYKEFGYNPIIVPKDNIKNRVDFVINSLK
jgi:predicted ATPase